MQSELIAALNMIASAIQNSNPRSQALYGTPVPISALTITSTTFQTFALISPPSAGKWLLQGSLRATDGGSAGFSDIGIRLVVNGTVVFTTLESFAPNSWLHLIPINIDFDFNLGDVVVLQANRSSGSKTLSVAANGSIYPTRIA